jgi:lipoprotein NlpD
MRWLLIISLLTLLAGCNKTWAPVEDRSVDRRSYALTADGHYRVRRGDTLHAIAFSFGLDWRDIAAWNRISPPYTIYPDQELRLSPPPRQAVSTQPARSPGTSQTRTAPKTTAPAPTRPAESSPDRGSQFATTAPPAAGHDPAAWRWPAEGRILSRFKANDPARNGIDIAGREGQAIVASADGEVVYSGSGLIAYGELIIIKHSDRMLSAYAHNRKRLVHEGQRVKAGQRIAEMGRDDRNQAMLHFEIRRDGKPQDPQRYLPAR